MNNRVTKKLIPHILWLMIIISIANASYDGFPYLCPEGINTDLIYQEAYEQAKQTYRPDPQGLCTIDKTDCETLYQKYAEEKSSQKIQQLANQIKSCDDAARNYINKIQSVREIDYNNYEQTSSLNSEQRYFLNLRPCNGALYSGYSECEIENKESELLNALDYKGWNQAYCNFATQQSMLSEQIEKEYEACWSSCKENSNFEELYKCSGFNCLNNNCQKCTDPNEEDRARNILFECTSGCKMDYERLDASYYSGCAVESFMAYSSDAVWMYMSYYLSEDSKYYKLASSPTFYASSPPELNLECPKGFFYDGKSCAPDIESKEEIQIRLDKETFDYSKDKTITGTLEYICEGQCSGKVATIEAASAISGLKFEIKYDKEKPYLSQSQPTIGFNITPKITKDTFITKTENKIKIIAGQTSKEIDFTIPVITNLEIEKFFDEPIRQGDTVEFEVSFDGPEEYEYTFVLSSALDSTFYIGEEEHPISTFITTKDNFLEFEWETPMISREVDAKNFYLDELGQFSTETLSTVTQTVSFMALGDAIKAYTGTTGDAFLDAVNNDVTDLTLGGGDVLLTTYTSMDPIPVAMSIASIYHQNPVTSTLGSMTYSTYQAYDRASQRLHAFSSDKTHIYDVPIKIVVKPKGMEPQTIETKVKVEAPEVIYK